MPIMGSWRASPIRRSLTLNADRVCLFSRMPWLTYERTMPDLDPETLRRVARVAQLRAIESKSDPTFDGMARGGAQRVLQQLAKDLEAAAVLAERRIKPDESTIELVQVDTRVWRSNDGHFEFRSTSMRQGTMVDLYVDGSRIVDFFMAIDFNQDLEGEEIVYVFDILPEKAQTKVGQTTYGALLQAYVRVAEAKSDGRSRTVDFNPSRACRIGESLSP